MTWQTLLAKGRVRSHTTSKQELDDLRAVIARDLADAGIAALSADRRFATAYNAALQTATMAIASAGYRTLGPTAATLTSYFDGCRRKRNIFDYDRAHVATETEAGQILLEARNFLTLVESWITQTYPQFR